MKEFSGIILTTANLYNSDEYKIYKCVSQNESGDVKDGQTITIAGNMPELQPDTPYNISASPKTTKYGITYYINNIRLAKGANRQGMYNSFLASVTSDYLAKQILSGCPNFVQLVLDGKDSQIDLNKIKGVKETRFRQIKSKILSNIGIMDILEEYYEYELTFKTASKIFTACSSNIELVRERMQKNPYKLLTGIDGIGFKKADAILKKIRPDLLDSEYRLFSCADFLISENENSGSSWMYFKDLYNTISDYVPEATKHLKKVIENEKDFYYDPEQRRIATRRSYYKEVFIAEKIKEIMNTKSEKNDWTKFFGGKEPDYDKFRNIDGKFDLSDEQLKTLSMVFHNNFSVLTGSAGMGKSSGAKGLLNMLDSTGVLRYTLLAPTGAASEVLAKYTRRTASTIHRGILRGMDDDIEYKLYDDLIVIDEASMININLMYDTMMEISPTSKVLFICDPEQLPAIGCGKVIHDIIESGVVPVNKLTKVYRFEDGGLAKVTTDVRKGKKYLPEVITSKSLSFGTDKDYTFVLSPKEKMLKELLQVYMGLIKSGEDIKDIGIMSAMNVKTLGTIEINKAIQDILSEGKPSVKHKGIDFKLGDKVVQTVNDYSATKPNGLTTQIFNGNQGIISHVFEENKLIIVKFSDTSIVYTGSQLDNLSLAYATSVHKFQGSGCKIAIVVTPSTHTFMLNKNLLYTALTRSTHRTIHFADKIQTINTALRKSENYDRNTFLKEFLINN